MKKANSTDSQMNSSNQQVTKTSKDQNEVFVVVEELPEFIGGNEALMKYMMANFKYPAEAAKQGITGEVIVNYIVSSTGKIYDVKVEQPVNPLLDAEAIRLVSNMPDWKPGSQGGKHIDVLMKIPVDFKLN
jgi:TonB family protein